MQTEPSVALASLANQLITRQGASSGGGGGGKRRLECMCGDFVWRSVKHNLSVGLEAVCLLRLQRHSWAVLTHVPLCVHMLLTAPIVTAWVCF